VRMIRCINLGFAAIKAPYYENPGKVAKATP
jgi:hypothetical protein